MKKDEWKLARFLEFVFNTFPEGELDGMDKGDVLRAVCALTEANLEDFSVSWLVEMVRGAYGMDAVEFKGYVRGLRDGERKGGGK